MLPFALENLKRVNRVVARQERDQHVIREDGSLLRYSVMHLSFYIGAKQVAVGATRQKKARNGEFTTDRSGLRLTLKFLEEISGMPFKLQPYDGEVEEYHRNDLTVVPFVHKDSGIGKGY